jgi:periplasmic divalent cation tolerance protein
VPCLRSIYRWKGKICEDTEYLLFVKTPTDLFDQVSAAIREFHSYELPEILALPVAAAEANFHQWIIDMVEPGDDADDVTTDDFD